MRFRADAGLLDLGRLGGRSISEAIRSRRHSDQLDDSVARDGSSCLERARETVADHRRRHHRRCDDGVRHAGAAIVRHRNDQPRRFDERDLAQQLRRSTAARIIGPSIAGLLMAKVGIAMCFFLDGISFIAVISGLLMMRLPKHEPAPSEHGAIGQALEGFRYVWGHPRPLTILALFAVVGIFGWSYSVLMPAFAQDVLHLGEQGYGMLMAASGIGALLAALTVATAGQAFPTRVLALGGVWIFSVALALFAFNRNLYLALVLLAISGFGIVLYFSTSNTVLQTIVPDEMRGRVMGIWTLVFGGMMPLGSLQAGFIADLLGTPATIAIGALVCALAAFITLEVIRRREARTGVILTNR